MGVRGAADVRGILIYIMFCVLGMIAIQLLMFACVKAHAADRFYRLDPATWTLYSVTRSLPAVTAPDGSTVTPFQANASAIGNVGPAGYYSTGDYQTGLHLAPAGLDEFSMFYLYLSGDHGARLCIDGHVTGYPAHQCLEFDGLTGGFRSADHAIVDYSIAPIGPNGWLRVSITFKTAPTFAYGNQAFPYVQTANPGQRFALWRGFLITGQTP